MSTDKAQWVRSPDDPLLDELCTRLAAEADRLDASEKWPSEQLAWCTEFGLWSWFLPRRWEGQEWDESDVLRAYFKLGKACLTTTFITTQWSAAAKRIMACGNQALEESLAPGLLNGNLFTTVGISHLTTSRRHLAQPPLAARQDGADFVLEGFSPWVTGGALADVIVTGAVLADGRQILAAIPASAPGIQARRPLRLVGLSASSTGQVDFHQVRIEQQQLLAGPVENVLSAGAGTQTGGLQTSALALASSRASIDYLQRQAADRPDLQPATAQLLEESDGLEIDVLRLATGEADCTADEARARANSLALRASQAALAAAKGTGYLAGHPAGRYCREALFFLVWSCPQPVMMVNLCELAGLSD